jgi:hydroxymethylglutaryl-CoA lyase
MYCNTAGGETGEEMTRSKVPEVRIVEVGPRDGLQSIKDAVPTEVKIELIQRLRRAGLRSIELTSVVSTRKVPQLADCQEILTNPAIKDLIQHSEGNSLRLPVLTPNLKGLEIALSRGVKEVAVFISATEGFSEANINCSVEQGIKNARAVAQKAIEAGIAVRGYVYCHMHKQSSRLLIRIYRYVSCIFVDPYDGPTNPSSVLHCVQELLQMGCYEVSLGDTTGAGTPAKVATLIRYLEKNGIPLKRLAGHFHDTYGQAVANVLQAYICGIRVFDASVGGLGGCPFAPGAKGNVATEDVVLMFQNAGIQTGINLADLVATGNWINQQVRGSSESLRSDFSTDTVDTLQQKSRPRDKELWLPSFRPMSMKYMKTSLKRVKYADKIRFLQSENGDLKIILNRPNRGNLLTRSMITSLIKCLKTYHDNPSVSRVVITGTGPYFCAGVDMKRECSESSAERNNAFDLLVQLFEIIDQYPKPVIACLNGHACGAGVALAFACDERIMIQSATINLNPTKEKNILTDLLSRYFSSAANGEDALPRKLSSRPLTGSELQFLGLVSEIAEGKKDMQTKLESYLCIKDVSRRGVGSLTKL